MGISCTRSRLAILCEGSKSAVLRPHTARCLILPCGGKGPNLDLVPERGYFSSCHFRLGGRFDVFLTVFSSSGLLGAVDFFFFGWVRGLGTAPQKTSLGAKEIALIGKKGQRSSEIGGRRTHAARAKKKNKRHKNEYLDNRSIWQKAAVRWRRCGAGTSRGSIVTEAWAGSACDIVFRRLVLPGFLEPHGRVAAVAVSTGSRWGTPDDGVLGQSVCSRIHSQASSSSSSFFLLFFFFLFP